MPQENEDENKGNATPSARLVFQTTDDGVAKRRKQQNFDSTSTERNEKNKKQNQTKSNIT